MKRRLLSPLLALATTGLAVSPAAAVPLDCPLADAPYSVDTPLVDILLKPEARELLEEDYGSFLKNAPPGFLRTEAPTFAAIITPRSTTGWANVAPERLPEIDSALRKLPVTAQDRVARCARYDDDRPSFDLPKGKPALLVFEKVNGFEHTEALAAAHDALRQMAERRGWAIAFADKGGVMTPDTLARFDAVVWNNVSGDVLTLSQRAAFRAYIEHGGGFAAIHGSAGDPVPFWNWYVDDLIGARFLGHPQNPQFQPGEIVPTVQGHALSAELPPKWRMTDEWYSFTANPRQLGAQVLATLDEASYAPGNLAMGTDHPIAWRRSVGKGRAFYSAIGHLAQSYAEPNSLELLEAGIAWAMMAED